MRWLFPAFLLVSLSLTGNVAASARPEYRVVAPLVARCPSGFVGGAVRPPWDMDPYFLVVLSWWSPLYAKAPTFAFRWTSPSGQTYVTEVSTGRPDPPVDCKPYTFSSRLTAVRSPSPGVWSITLLMDGVPVYTDDFTYDGHVIN